MPDLQKLGTDNRRGRVFSHGAWLG
jgi:hypothetical protein